MYTQGQVKTLRTLFRSIHTVSTDSLRAQGASLAELLSLREMGLIQLHGDRWLIMPAGVRVTQDLA
jgi:hypothetical protein